MFHYSVQFDDVCDLFGGGGQRGAVFPTIEPAYLWAVLWFGCSWLAEI